MTESPSEPPKTNKRLQALVDSAMGLRKKKPKPPQNPLLPSTLIMDRVKSTYWECGSKGFCYNTAPIQSAPRSFHVQVDDRGRAIRAVWANWMEAYRFKPWAAWKIRINHRKHTRTPIGEPIFFARRKAASAKAYSWYEKAEKKRKEATASQPTLLEDELATHCICGTEYTVHAGVKGRGCPRKPHWRCGKCGSFNPRGSVNCHREGCDGTRVMYY